MKKLFTLALLIQVATFSYSQTWTQKATFPGGPRYGTTSLTLGDKIYVGLGTNFSTYYHDWWQYDSSNDTWVQKASFPGMARYISTGIAINDKGYVGLGIGSNGSFPRDWWEYNPATDTWTEKAMFPYAGRYGTSNFEINGKGYVCLGNKGSATGPYTKQLWEYDPASDMWTAKADFPAISRYGGTGFSIGNLGYAGLGGIKKSTGSYVYYSDFYEYNPSTDSWTQKAGFPNRRTFPSTFVIDGMGFVGLGQKQGTHYYMDFYSYGPGTNSWSPKISFPATGRFIPAGAAVNGKGYAGTGYSTMTGLFYGDWWELTPAQRLSSQSGNEQSNDCFVQLIQSGNSLVPTFSTGDKLDGMEFRLFDVNGQLIQSQTVTDSSPIQIKNDLSKGEYFAVFTTFDQRACTHKIMIW